MEASDFCLSCSGFMREVFFSQSLMIFGGWIGDLRNSCFVGDFALLGLLRVGVVDPTRFFFFCLDYHIRSLHFQPIAELVLGKIRPSVIFSGASETWANHSLLIGSISLRVFYICCLNWSYPPAGQQKCSCFLPCRSLLFSMLPGRTSSSCFTSIISFL